MQTPQRKDPFKQKITEQAAVKIAVNEEMAA